MREAIKEYVKLCRLSGRWLRKYWRFWLFCLAVYYGVVYAWLRVDGIKDYLRNLKK